jgi:hypothetical protein
MNKEITQQYAAKYPGQGKVAILCEGDLAGYETDIIARITSSYVFADVFPCGTQEAIFGFSDAIGRAVPVVAIEDRDFRSQDSACKECNAKAESRKERGVDLRGWRTWRRAEIENYLIDPKVSVSVLAEIFSIQESVIHDRLETILNFLAIDQAAMYTIYAFWSSLPKPTSHIPGLPRKVARPRWVAATTPIVLPASNTVEVELQKAVQDAAKHFGVKSTKINVESLMDTFRRKCTEWAAPHLTDLFWLNDWAGKEVLCSLLRWLTAEFGWPRYPVADQTRVNWEELTSAHRDSEIDRELARALQPYFVHRFCDIVQAGEDSDLIREWSEIKQAILQTAVDE